MTKKNQECEREYESANIEVKYYDMLYNFASVVTKANEQSFEGLEPKRIADTLRRSARAFLKLCMVESIGEDKGKTKHEAFSEVQGHEKNMLKNDETVAVPEQDSMTELKQKEKALPDNFLKIDKDGWGLCPVCHTKVLKVTATTRLENFPVFCKRCRADHLVNWWNAENQRILYKRYINDRYIKDQALKGTGLCSFRNTGASVQEKVAMRA